jgi:protein ImuB
VAVVAAREAAPGECLVVPPDEEKAFLAPRPVSHLPVGEETLRRLALLGLRTLGHLAEIPVEHLVHQFGKEGGLMARLARGEDPAPLVPLQDPEPLAEALTFEMPVARLEPLLGGIEGLLSGLFARLRKRGGLCTRVVLVLAPEQGSPAHLALDLASPQGDPEGIMSVLLPRLSRLRLTGPVAGLEVRLEGLVPETGRQGSLLPGPEDRRRGLRNVLRHLHALGQEASLLRVVWDDPDSRIPERRAHLEGLEGE